MSISVRRLAQLAKISPMSASRALRGCGDVSDATRRKVLALARKYNVPLPPVRAQETPNLLHVCAALIEFGDEQSAEGFNHRLLAGLQQGAAACSAELANYQSPGRDIDTWPLVVNRREVDGVVLARGNEFVPHPPYPAPVPAVFIFAGPEGADVVTVENFDTGMQFAAHLAALGHRRAAYIGFKTNMSLKRLYGLRAGMHLAGGSVPDECTFIAHQRGPDGFREFADQLLHVARPGDPGPNGVTALMVYNDYFAAVVIQRLRERGVRVPEDISVVGFDNVRPPGYDGPALTTAVMPLEELGAEAARLLYWRKTHPDAPPRKLVLTAPLVAGASTGAVGSAG
jgi:DNA-binding LacI/PurR family transcriptional regulator